MAKQLPLDHPLVVEALTGVRARSLKLACDICDRFGRRPDVDSEVELANFIGNHIIAAEWPAAATFYAEALCVPPTKTV